MKLMLVMLISFLAICGKAQSFELETVAKQPAVTVYSGTTAKTFKITNTSNQSDKVIHVQRSTNIPGKNHRTLAILKPGASTIVNDNDIMIALGDNISGKGTVKVEMLDD